jgi:NarL family two-component system response regulator LiaR
MNQIQILIADDHPVVQDGLQAVLGTQVDFEITGVAGTGMEVLRKVAAHEPDIVLLDLEMPEMDGLEVLENLRRDHPKVKVIVFTAFDTDEQIVGAVKAGAKGYLLKGAPSQDLFEAIRTVSKGGSLLQPIVASKLIELVSGESDLRRLEETVSLTDRERQVLEQLALGKTNKEIAQELVITERTVKFHVSSIFSKLGVSNRTEAVTIAARQGLVTLDKQLPDR